MASETLFQVYSLIDALTASTDHPILGIGIGTPGLLDTTRGRSPGGKPGVERLALGSAGRRATSYRFTSPTTVV
jgi:hypothetical protein